MPFVHECPVHGTEECLMGEKARNHACRHGGFVFTGRTQEREIVVLSLLREVIAADDAEPN